MKSLVYLFILSIVLVSCSSESTDGSINENDSTHTAESMSFEILDAEKSGIDFTNSITEDEKFNFYEYEYIYNGGGVAVGDINNDGLTDIYFTGNQVSDKLYLNKGDLKFEDITEQAMPEGFNEGWHTGVNMADVNGDGWLDIYVCRSGSPEDVELKGNLLFINNQDNTFSEKGIEYGVNVQKRSTHSAFFDYDNDGDLDLYVLNHPLKTSDQKFVSADEFIKLKSYGEDADVFLENVDGKYVDVSKEAGIINNCYGLGIAIGDLDDNGFQDIYISNDYQDPDFMYMNNGDGTFTNRIEESTNHISNFSMGNDMADFNNDGLLDIMTVDMASEDHIRSKRNMGGMSTKNFWDLVNVGFHYQYMFNGLQMNNGNGTFSEVAQMAGVSKTDWSWAPLFADFNNDGNKDLFVTNGYRREARDNDYSIQHSMRKEKGQISSFEDELEQMPTTKIYNYIYEGSDGIHMKKKTADWKIDYPVNSNGAAFADFDGDGDLDLVLNNMEEKSFIMENKLVSSNNYIRIKLNGNDKNTHAIGAKIKITTQKGIQYHDLSVSRGYQSSVESIVHFGLGDIKTVDKIEIIWPNGKKSEKLKVTANQLIEFSANEAVDGEFSNETVEPLFTKIDGGPLNYQHKEFEVNDFEVEVLLPHKMSQLGPFASSGDLNGDGLEDIYISGAADFPGEMYFQAENGQFELVKGPWESEKKREELGSIIFDVDNDGDNDLYIVSGGNEFNFNSPLNYDQLYINQGNGTFKNESTTRLPLMETSGQAVVSGDYDNDGDLDLFVGGRQTPGYYPFSPRSFLLQNDGKGNFIDATQSATAPSTVEGELSLMGPGMVTDALFNDFDDDGDLDLVVVGEWMPITFFENNDGIFKNVNSIYNPKQELGWYYSISADDLNGDGKSDFVVGNVGENNKFHPSFEKPLEIYCHDFDGNGSYDIVLAKYQDNVCYPVRGRQCSSEQMPFITEKFPSYAKYATADVEEIYGEEQLEKALHFSASNFHSLVLLSKGNTYEYNILPELAQMGPLNKTIIDDFNGDGNLDIIGAGNNFSVEVETVRYDGGRGIVLLGNGKGDFQALSPNESGFFENKDCKDMLKVQVKGREVIFTFSNRAPASSFKIN